MNLEAEVEQLRRELDAVLRVLWAMRGFSYQKGGKIENELDDIHSEYLERNKNGHKTQDIESVVGK